MEPLISKQVESAAYHEAGHMTAAVLQAMPIRETGLHVDLYGNGCADYFERSVGDLTVTELDHRERQFTIIALYAAHVAQLKFYPDCLQVGWREDLKKVMALTREMYSTNNEAMILQEELRRKAKRLVDDHWTIIEELAKNLLSKPCTSMSQQDTQWGTGLLKRQMPGFEIVEFFALHKIRARVVGDDVRQFDSTQDVPHYDSLA